MDLGMYAFILATYFRMHPDNAKLRSEPVPNSEWTHLRTVGDKSLWQHDDGRCEWFTLKSISKDVKPSNVHSKQHYPSPDNAKEEKSDGLRAFRLSAHGSEHRGSDGRDFDAELEAKRYPNAPDNPSPDIAKLVEQAEQFDPPSTPTEHLICRLGTALEALRKENKTAWQYGHGKSAESEALREECDAVEEALILGQAEALIQSEAALEALRNDLQLSRLTSIELISEKTALRKECEQTCEHLNAKTLAVDALMDKLDKALARCQELENELNDMRAKANRD